MQAPILQRHGYVQGEAFEVWPNLIAHIVDGRAKGRITNRQPDNPSVRQGGAPFTTLGAAILRWRKRIKNRPLVIIDDAGLCLRKVGELMPWSEIQSVKLECANPDAEYFLIVCRDQRYEFGARFLDRNGVRWSGPEICEGIKERWQRKRHLHDSRRVLGVLEQLIELLAPVVSATLVIDVLTSGLVPSALTPSTQLR
jgi:hypothetical protein